MHTITHPRNRVAQLRLLAALRDAVDACKELTDDLDGHEHIREPHYNACAYCDLESDAEGMLWTLEIFHQAIDCQTVRGVTDAVSECREELKRAGLPVPAELAEPKRNPFYRG